MSNTRELKNSFITYHDALNPAVRTALDLVRWELELLRPL